MSTDPQNILRIHIAGLSLTTLALPALRSLRQHLPNARISVASSAPAADLVRLAQCVDEVLPINRFRGTEILNPGLVYRGAKSLGEIRRNIYDLAIQFKSCPEAGIVLQLANPLSRLNQKNSPLETVLEKVTQGLIKPQPIHVAHEYLKRLEPLGVRPIESEPRLQTDKLSDELIEKLLRKHGLNIGELLIGIHAGAGRGKQRWPIQRFASIGARMIHNFNARIMIFAGPDERGLAKRLAAMLPEKKAIAIQSPKIDELVSAAARMSLLIGNHSGTAHVAAAAGAPVVVACRAAPPTAQHLPANRIEHLRASHIELISEDDVYEAACRLLKTSRAEFL